MAMKFGKIAFTVLGCLALGAASVQAGETIYYAAPDGTGSGASPDDPADLLTAFSKCGNGTGWDKATKNFRTIMLAAGDYDFSKIVRDDTSSVTNLMWINKDKNKYIWFKGAVNADGTPASRIIGGGPELNMRLLYAQNVSSAFRMESLCITNFGSSTAAGGAIDSYVGTDYGCFMSNCEFRCCSATTRGAISSGSRIPAYDCKFVGNRFTGVTTQTGLSGCGACNSLTCIRCLFEDNGHPTPDVQNKYHGGAACDCDCYGCAFVGNRAHNTSALACTAKTGIKVIDCVFTNNTSYYSGGGTVVGVSSQQPVVTNCVFYGNILSAGDVVSNVAATNCRFMKNSAPQVLGSGCTARDCLVYDNSCTFDNVCSCTVINCLFMSNVSNSRVVNGAVSIKNCVFYGNVRPNGAASAIKHANATIEASVENGAEVPDCFTYDADGVPTGILRNKASKNLLIDKGVDVGWTAADRDLAGNTRVFNGVVDVGCFEWPGPFPGLMLIVR